MSYAIRLGAILRAVIVFALVAITPLRAATVTIDFEIFGSIRGIHAISGSRTEGPVTISPLYGHFDAIIDRGLQSSGSTAVGLHNGGNGSGIRFAFSETLLALSFDVSGWILANNGMPNATVTSSAGGSFTIPHATTGTFDLTTESGFDGIDWIDVTMPAPADTCVFFSNGRSLNCSTMFIDLLIVDALPPPPPPPPSTVPIPAGLPLFVAALWLLRLIRLRRPR